MFFHKEHRIHDDNTLLGICFTQNLIATRVFYMADLLLQNNFKI